MTWHEVNLWSFSPHFLDPTLSAQFMESKYVFRPFVGSSLNLPHEFPSNFSCCPVPYTILFYFWKMRTRFPLGFFFVFFFFHLGPMGMKISKCYTLLPITTEDVQVCPEFSSQWSSENYVWDIWNFEYGGGGGIRLIVGFQPLMVISPTASWCVCTGPVLY